MSDKETKVENPPAKSRNWPRRLRITVSVFFAVVAVAFVVLWVRSYLRSDVMTRQKISVLMIGSNYGHLTIRHFRSYDLNRPQNPATTWSWTTNPASDGTPRHWFNFRSGQQAVAIPYAVLCILFGLAAVLPFARTQFSVRTLLIATTLVAVVLGLGVWLAS
jgi:hypothetical protein